MNGTRQPEDDRGRNSGDLIRLADALGTTVAGLVGSPPQRPPEDERAGRHPVLDQLREDECRRLIEPGGIGRVGFDVAGRMAIVPVNYGIHGGTVVFRTGATTALGRYGTGAVAFEIERIDEGLHQGWSVLIRGTARLAGSAEVQQLERALTVEPWAGGGRPVYVIIEPEQISGRRIRAW